MTRNGRVDFVLNKQCYKCNNIIFRAKNDSIWYDDAQLTKMHSDLKSYKRDITTNELSAQIQSLVDRVSNLEELVRQRYR